VSRNYPSAAGPFTFAVAGAADDADVRRLLRERALPGRICLSFEREPNASDAAAIEGEPHQTVVARDVRTGVLAGVASRAVRRVFVNGEPVRLGYFGQLRVADGTRRLRSLIDDGFACLRELHAAGDAPAYLVSLVAGNPAARRLLIERRSRTGPRFVPAGRLTTFVLPARGEAGPYENHVAEEDLAACLQRNLRRCQFAPVWDAELLRSPSRTRGLSADDFVVVERGGRVVGCAALWDQRAFKQVVVRGYEPALGRTRWLVNAAAPWMGIPRLPPVGRHLAFAFISHLAVDDDDPGVAASLVAALRARARARGLEYVIAAAPPTHPIAGAIAALGRHRQYASELFLACWPDGEDFVRAIDGRPPQPEVAIL
jgi:N-acetylglutamate synthase-like GNAT family acetyltransferase